LIFFLDYRINFHFLTQQAVDRDRSGEISVEEYKLFFKCLGLEEEVIFLFNFEGEKTTCLILVIGGSRGLQGN
jgi:hypothetical protein